LKIIRLSYESDPANAEWEGNWRAVWLELRKKALDQRHPITPEEFDEFNRMQHIDEHMSAHYFNSLKRIIGKSLKDLSWQTKPPLCFGKARVYPRKYIPKEFVEDRQGKPLYAVLYVAKSAIPNSRIIIYDVTAGEIIETLNRIDGGLWQSETFKNYGKWLENGSMLMSLKDSNPLSIAEITLRSRFSNCDIEIQPSYLPPEVFKIKPKEEDPTLKFAPSLPPQEVTPSITKSIESEPEIETSDPEPIKEQIIAKVFGWYKAASSLL